VSQQRTQGAAASFNPGQKKVCSIDETLIAISGIIYVGPSA